MSRKRPISEEQRKKNIFQENRKKISVIIPVYNMEKYIGKCINSLFDQTIKDIEIICVNDASTDNSLSVLNSFLDDDRIEIIDLKENSTANIARKAAVDKASGEYVLFVDADDTLEPGACEFLYNKMKETDADIIHFGTNIINCADLPEQRINNMKKFVAPYIGTLQGEEVFKCCFENPKYRFSIWNKIYKMPLIRKSFEYVQNIPLPKAQDKYIYFIISYFAKSYLGINETFYNYHFGHGVTGHNVLDIDSFRRYCTMGNTSKAIKDFVEAVNDIDNCEAAYQKAHKDMFNDCFANYFNLPANEQGKGFDMMTEYFDSAEIVSAFAKKFWWNQDIAVNTFSSAESLTVKKDKIRTIATYYHKLECGGVQMVLVKLAELWKKLGYNVIVITDCEPCEGDYDLPEDIERVVIPSFFDINKDNYYERAKALQKVIADYSIDAFVYHAWASNILLWDMMLCKLNNVKVMIHTHSIFSMPLRNLRVFWSTLPYVYTLADGVITLSNTDKEYWENFNDNVFKVVNPVRYGDLSEVPVSKLTSHNIIWCQRFSSEKRPLDAIEIFNRVHKRVPTAKLFMLGKGTTPDIYNQIKRKLAEYQIEEDVILFGYQKDVQMFYELCSVYLMTSEYEGFSLSLLEAMSAGIPAVTYDMPYLTMLEANKGIVSVPPQNFDAAANAVVELLTNDEYRFRMGREAREQAVETLSFDYDSEWTKILSSLETKTLQSRKVSTMWKTLFSHYNYGVVRNNNEMTAVKKKSKELEEKLKQFDEKALLNAEELSKQLSAEKAKFQAEQKQNNETRSKCEQLKQELDKKKKENEEAKIKYEQLKQELDKKKKENEEIKNKLNVKTEECRAMTLSKENSEHTVTEIRKSFSYKLAMLFTWLPRKLRGGK